MDKYLMLRRYAKPKLLGTILNKEMIGIDHPPPPPLPSHFKLKRVNVDFSFCYRLWQYCIFFNFFFGMDAPTLHIIDIWWS